MKWGLKGGFQLMQILDLSGMYFDAAVVFVSNSSLLFRLALAILCLQKWFDLIVQVEKRVISPLLVKLYEKARTIIDILHLID